jgi:hypothetical protein
VNYTTHPGMHTPDAVRPGGVGERSDGHLDGSLGAALADLDHEVAQLRGLMGLYYRRRLRRLRARIRMARSMALLRYWQS